MDFAGIKKKLIALKEIVLGRRTVLPGRKDQIVRFNTTTGADGSEASPASDEATASGSSGQPVVKRKLSLPVSVNAKVPIAVYIPSVVCEKISAEVALSTSISTADMSNNRTNSDDYLECLEFSDASIDSYDSSDDADEDAERLAKSVAETVIGSEKSSDEMQEDEQKQVVSSSGEEHSSNN